MVESEVGEDRLSQVMDRAGMPAAYEFRMNEVYPDDQWGRLFKAVCETLNVNEQDAYAQYAVFFIADAQRRWPTWFEMSRTAREFLERQPHIHNGFSTGIQDPDARQAINDKFSLDSAGDELIVHYRSPNKMCGFYEALARAVLAHYGEEAVLEQKRCMRKGDPECEIHIRWH